jgi:class 3 adenylate cyclase
MLLSHRLALDDKEKSVTEREQLEQAIAALEAQRAILGDAVVDPAIAGLRKQLAELEPTSAEQTRKQVTVLFADISGFTTMSETMDTEELSDTMSALWQRIDAVILEHGGMIDKHIGDAVIALWGADEAREDDPERAIRAALAAQAKLAAFREERDVQLAMRVGLNTGPVLLGEVRPGEFTAMGDTVNLASRLEHAAPVGRVLISHGTYRHVRGIFDVLPQEPLTVKGKTEPVQTYVMSRPNHAPFAWPRQAWRASKRAWWDATRSC